MTNPGMNASYRLQLTPDFTFADVEKLLPYFAKLGVSHLYLSPITEARLGSSHGYDVIDHNSVREAFGGREGLGSLMSAAKAHNLRFILDFVPNHAGVAPRNVLWHDVLAYGPHSPHAGFFDIDWHPLKEELENKVLLPFLGSPYGEVVDGGELDLLYLEGRFYVTYYESRFALNPASYPLILERLLPRFERNEVYFDLKDLDDAYAELLPHEVEKAEALRVRLAALAERLHLTELPVLEPPIMHALLERQFWRLAHWQTAGYDINYRRFFDINELVALHMETPEVFWAAHKLLGELALDDGLEGVRIDHIDGLFDPQGYLDNLKALGVRKAWVEKILAAGEVLPETWVTAGTSGYEFMNDVLGVLVYPGGEAPLLRSYRRFLGDVKPYEDEVHDAKLLVMETSLSGELVRLTTELQRLAEADYHTRDFTLQSLQEALAEIIAAFPRYRTYLPHGPEEARAIIREAVGAAKRRNPATELSVYDFIEGCLTEAREGDLEQAREAIVGRFQQYTAPVTAKGVEDTTFYRYLPFAARNEVGGEPERFTTEPHAFHARARFRAFRYPENLLATATHDHKRGEDTRMRLAALAEIPELWEETVTKLHERALELQRLTPGVAPFAVSLGGSDLYLLYQLLGALTVGETPEGLKERLLPYMEKAMREAKLKTSWLNPDSEYEAAVKNLIEQLLTDETALAILEPLATEMARLGFYNTLAQTILKLTTPGVPDFYQGTELLDLSLVDPDNRRPVDYEARSRLIDALEPLIAHPDAETFRGWLEAQDPQAKMYLTTHLLRVRRDHPELFAGEYRDLAATGEGVEHLIAFTREGGGDALVALVTRFPKHASETDLSAVTVELPEPLQGRGWLELLSGQRFTQDAFSLGELPLPFAVLISE
jgi:(1->4)-alpha-D-glucan 1-alpha-D-glucosylmutase